jgi:hypothetical protein
MADTAECSDVSCSVALGATYRACALERGSIHNRFEVAAIALLPMLVLFALFFRSSEASQETAAVS